MTGAFHLLRLKIKNRRTNRIRFSIFSILYSQVILTKAVIFSLGCNLQSPRNLKKFPMPRPPPRPLQSESLGGGLTQQLPWATMSQNHCSKASFPTNSRWKTWRRASWSSNPILFTNTGLHLPQVSHLLCNMALASPSPLLSKAALNLCHLLLPPCLCFWRMPLIFFFCFQKE